MITRQTNPASLTTEEREQRRRMFIGVEPVDVLRGDNESYVVFCKTETTATGFKGKALKPAFNYRFKSKEHRDQYCHDWITGIKRRQQQKAEQRHARNKPHTLHVGDVLKCSWGFEQTNVDYYEVVATNGATIATICQIECDSRDSEWMQGESTPCPGNYVGEPSRHRVNGETNAISLSSFQTASKIEPIAYAGVAPIYKASHWTAYA